VLIQTRLRSFWNIATTSIRILVQTRSLREAINQQFHDENKIIVELGVIEYVVTKKGDKFYMSRLLNTMIQAERDYCYEDMRPTDIVIDVGASIGGFSIPASRKAKHVYAIEPMTSDMLKANILLNERENIDVLDIALGDGRTTRLEWLGESRNIETETLTAIKEICGGCDFLKIDCEGCEWDIKPEELEGIRRIEMEVHKIGFPLSMMEERLRKAAFSYEIKTQPEGNIGLWIIHAVKNDEK